MAVITLVIVTNAVALVITIVFDYIVVITAAISIFTLHELLIFGHIALQYFSPYHKPMICDMSTNKIG